MTILDLLDSMFVVIRCHRDVTTVDNFQAGEEWVYFERDVIAAV